MKQCQSSSYRDHARKDESGRRMTKSLSGWDRDSTLEFLILPLGRKVWERLETQGRFECGLEVRDPE